MNKKVIATFFLTIANLFLFQNYNSIHHKILFFLPQNFSVRFFLLKKFKKVILFYEFSTILTFLNFLAIANVSLTMQIFLLRIASLFLTILSIYSTILTLFSELQEKKSELWDKKLQLHF